MAAIVEGIRLDDTGTLVIDTTDNTKAARFECSTISTGTTRVFTFPDQDLTFGTATSVAADNITAGDSAVSITTSSGSVTVTSQTTSAGLVANGKHFFTVDEDTSSASTVTYAFSLAAQSAALYKANIVCYNSTDNTSFSILVEGMIERDEANNTQVLGTNTTTTRGTADSHSVTVTADDGNDRINLNLIPNSTDALEWRGNIEIFTNDGGLTRVS
jgi:hypothetical protein